MDGARSGAGGGCVAWKGEVVKTETDGTDAKSMMTSAAEKTKGVCASLLGGGQIPQHIIQFYKL